MLYTDTLLESTTVETLQNQFSGYGSTASLVAKAISNMKLPPLDKWDNATISEVVKAFTNAKFPTVLALNKIDHPDSDKNVSKIVRAYPESKAVLTSAITEVLLRKLVKQGYIKYEEGTEFVDTAEDLPDEGLKLLDENLKK